MLGLETALALTITELVAPGVLGLADALALLSWRPAAIAGLTDHGGPSRPGRPATSCVVDPDATWTVDAEPGWPAAPATRPTPDGRSPAGCATRSAAASPSSWTARRSDERARRVLVLADGTIFEGELVGAPPAGGVAAGEVVFNTALSGYQEILTDPSYAGQIITFTYPHIGNYGVNEEDAESRRPFCRGVVVRELTDRPSSWRATDGLGAYLTRTASPGSPASTRAASPGTSATPARCPARSAPTRRRFARRPATRPAPTGATSSRR